MNVWALQVSQRLAEKERNLKNGPACFRKPLCTDFLVQLQNDDRSDKLIGSDYSHVCNFKENPRESIHTLEKSLREENQDLLGATNFFPSQCASSTDNSFDAKKRLSRHYYSLARLAETQRRVVQQIGMTQKMLGENALEKSSCDQFSFPKSVEACMNLKNECKQLDKAETEKSLNDMAATSSKVVKERKAVQRDIESLENQNRFARMPAHKKELRDKMESKLKQLNEIESKAPWVAGEAFQKTIDKTNSPKEAIKAQLRANLDTFNQYIKDSEWVTQCLKGYEKNCDVDKVRKIIESSLDVAPQKVGKAERAQLESHYQFHRCVQTARIDYSEMNKVVGGALVDVALVIGGLPLGGGPFVVAGERVLLRTIAGAARANKARTALGALELTANGANSFHQFQNAKEACRDMVGLKTLSAPSSGKCEVESLKESPAVMKNYSNCLSHAKLFFAGGAVFSVAAFKLSYLASMKSEVKDASKGAKQDVATAGSSSKTTRRTDDFAGVEHRKPTERVVNGFQGHIIETNPKIEALPQLKSLNIEVVKVKGLDGVESLHFKNPVQLKDGTWVNSWPEVKIDPVTGFIDANFPGGRQLFEAAAKQTEGKGFVGFIDLGNLGVINKKFLDEEAAGDAFLKAVSKIISEKTGGKATAARLGGDELGLVIHEADPAKAKKIMAEIIETVRSKGSEARKIFDDEKRHLVAEAKNANTFEELQERQDKLKEFSKVQMPDLSMGLAHLTPGGNFADDLGDAEKMATEMKIPNKIATGMPAEKYGSYETPRKFPRPQAQNYDVQIAPERPSALGSDMATGSRIVSSDRDIQITPTREIKRFNDVTLSEYKDEIGQISYRVEKFITDPNTGKRIPISHEIPTRGGDHLIDGLHPESQKLAMGHFLSSAEPDRALVMVKLRSLRYLNYFASGTNTGDQMLSVVAQSLKTELKRDSDLKMKLGGADFLASVDHMKPQQIAQLQKRIQQAVQDSPVAKAILEKEKKALAERIRQVQDRVVREADTVRKAELQREADDLRGKLKQVDNFDFQLELQSLRPDQVNSGSTFGEIRKQLDDLFAR